MVLSKIHIQLNPTYMRLYVRDVIDVTVFATVILFSIDMPIC